MRTITKEALENIKRWEGLRLEAYQDIAGVWTIGYGHTDDVKAGQTITASEAEELLKQDLQKFEQNVSEVIQVELNDNQFAALVSFAFNVGVDSFQDSTLVKKLNKGDYDSVPKELSRWVYAKGDKSKGLINRRNVETGLWSKGDFVSSGNSNCESLKIEKIHQTVEGKSAIFAFLGAFATASSDYAQQILPYIGQFTLLRYAFLGLTCVSIIAGLFATGKRLQE